VLIRYASLSEVRAPQAGPLAFTLGAVVDEEEGQVLGVSGERALQGMQALRTGVRQKRRHGDNS
jgi:hypothetical protein